MDSRAGKPTCLLPILAIMVPTKCVHGRSTVRSGYGMGTHRILIALVTGYQCGNIHCGCWHRFPGNGEDRPGQKQEGGRQINGAPPNVSPHLLLAQTCPPGEGAQVNGASPPLPTLEA